MSNNGSPQPPSSLELEALWYVSGEMDEAAVLRFESRLADDQQARDALVAAMALLAPFDAESDKGPNPCYRRVVHRRLRSRRKFSRALRAVGWSVTGAAAASLAFAMVGHFRTPPRVDPIRTVHVERSFDIPPTHVIYSELSNADRISKVMAEQEKKRQRFEELRSHGNEGAPAKNGAQKSSM